MTLEVEMLLMLRLDSDGLSLLLSIKLEPREPSRFIIMPFIFGFR